MKTPYWLVRREPKPPAFDLSAYLRHQSRDQTAERHARRSIPLRILCLVFAIMLLAYRLKYAL